MNKNTRVVVQGITGKEGCFHATRARPTDAGRRRRDAWQGREEVEGISVFNTVRDAVKKTQCDTLLIFVPPPFCADAILEAADAGVKLIICITEGIPVNDMVKVKRALYGRDVRLIGLTARVITVDEAKIGIMPGFIHKKGSWVSCHAVGPSPTKRCISSRHLAWVKRLCRYWRHPVNGTGLSMGWLCSRKIPRLRQS